MAKQLAATRVDESVFEQLKRAVKSEEPQIAVKALLKSHRNASYFEDLRSKAKVMLGLRILARNGVT